jgi:NAD(P)-dependent dehydrogenase (short-subunit alcohol dehydrogenase family)
VSERLKGKVILIAGGGGMGNEMARRFTQEGASVVLGDIDLASAQAAAKDIDKAIAVHLDGADEVSIKAAVAKCRDAFGGLDGMHVNFASFADIGEDIGVMDIALEAYDETMRVNARGYLLCTRHALPEMIKRGGGSIVYTSSGAAYRGEPTRLAYAMSKAAILPLMRHVANRHGRDGVRANAIAPGVVLHEKHKGLTQDYINEFVKVQSIKSRVGRPSDIAAMSALLMSDEGSFITGQIIPVDGGLTMRA